MCYTITKKGDIHMEFKYKKVTLFMITLASFFFLVGCTEKKIDTSTLMDDIIFEAVELAPIGNNETNVMIKMTNNSEYKIIQNTTKNTRKILNYIQKLI